MGVTPLVLARDPKAHLIDLCARIEVRDCCPLKGKGEYEEMQWVGLEQLQAMGKANFVPLSWHLIQVFAS